MLWGFHSFDVCSQHDHSHGTTSHAALIHAAAPSTRPYLVGFVLLNTTTCRGITAAYASHRWKLDCDRTKLRQRRATASCTTSRPSIHVAFAMRHALHTSGWSATRKRGRTSSPAARSSSSAAR
eukprot:4724722-Prymnesium_polylepis.1